MVPLTGRVIAPKKTRVIQQQKVKKVCCLSFSALCPPIIDFDGIVCFYYKSMDVA